MTYDRKTLIIFGYLPIFAIAFFVGFFGQNPLKAISNETAKLYNPNRQIAAIIPFKDVDELKKVGENFKFEEENKNVEQSIPQTKVETQPVKAPLEEKEFQYIMITDSCDYNYEGKDCVEAYAEPRPGVPPVARFREGIVLRIQGEISYDGMTWYKVSFADQTLHRPERLINDWYVRGEDVEVFYGKGERSISTHGQTPTEKRIIVDISEQKMYAYDDEELFMEVSVSTGRELSQTPIGEHAVFQKMPSRYMQGPNPHVSSFYDLPGVPWNLYFTTDGAVIHGAYWHESFGTPYSHGCVNLDTEQAKKLYDWTPLGTKVLVQE